MSDIKRGIHENLNIRFSINIYIKENTLFFQEFLCNFCICVSRFNCIENIRVFQIYAQRISFLDFSNRPSLGMT